MVTPVTYSDSSERDQDEIGRERETDEVEDGDEDTRRRQRTSVRLWARTREMTMPESGRWADSRCSCCGDLLGRSVSRRHILKVAGVAGVAGAAMVLHPLVVCAEAEAEALVLSCIDPRVQEPVHTYLDKLGLTGRYSHFVIAGAAIGVVSPVFFSWHKTFWDNLAISVRLNQVKKVIALDHRDCGTAKTAYSEAALATPAAETKTHQRVLAQFRKQVGERQPKLAVETGLMGLDGSVEMLS
jgi:carbonic anhydrase